MREYSQKTFEEIVAKYVEMNGYDIKKCTDIKELIKELYRNVG